MPLDVQHWLLNMKRAFIQYICMYIYIRITYSEYQHVADPLHQPQLPPPWDGAENGPWRPEALPTSTNLRFLRLHHSVIWHLFGSKPKELNYSTDLNRDMPPK